MSFVLAKPGEVNVLQPTSTILGVERPVDPVLIPIDGNKPIRFGKYQPISSISL